VTAGVLRGEKSRFQLLFGDTVNTAAQMESNGKRGRIYLSRSTTDKLIKIGTKSSWLVAREEIISVKGKGDLQTNFLSMAGAGTSHTTSNDSSAVSY
jgi:class 3 adenylate cyclase